MVHSVGRFVLSFALCFFVLVCFSVILVLRIPRLGKRKLILVLFVRLFDSRLFGFVFPLPLGVWEGLRLVIVALPGLFSYLFWVKKINDEPSHVDLHCLQMCMFWFAGLKDKFAIYNCSIHPLDFLLLSSCMFSGKIRLSFSLTFFFFI